MGWRDYKNHRNTMDTQNDLDHGFNAAQWGAEIQKLVEEIRQHDPYGGCWAWVKINLADKWRLLMATMEKIDIAFQEQCPGELHQTITSARRLYHDCVTAWGNTRK